MHSIRKRGSFLVAMLVSVFQLANTGCMSCWKPVETPELHCGSESCYHCDGEVPLWQSVPGCSKRHVYVFFVQGCDIFDTVNLAGVKEYVQSIGFTKTYHGQLFYRKKFGEEMCRIQREDPDAHFVVIGTGTGSQSAYELTQDAGRAGVPVDLLVYLEPKGLSKETHGCANVTRVIHVTGGSWTSKSEPIDGAYNVNYPEAGCCDVPAHPFTLELLARELGTVAAAVPYVTMEHPNLIENRPTPRPVSPTRSAPDSEWDFLVPQPLVVPPQRFQHATEPEGIPFPPN